MKKILAAAIALIICFAVLTPASKTSADAFDPFNDVCTGTGSGGTVCVDKGQSQGVGDNSIWGPRGVFNKAINLVSIVIGIGAVAMIILSGFKFVTSGGDAAKIANARQTIMFALIGVVVAIFAQAMLLFVLDKL